MTAPRDLPAPGRRQTLCVALRLGQSPVFLINSRLDLFAVAGPGSGGVPLHRSRHPFSRSYGAVLPSSFTMVLPIALVCSTHPPVSVCGTGTSRIPRGFSRQHGLTGFALRLRPAPQAHVAPAFHWEPPYAPSRGRPEPRPATLLRRPIGSSALPGVRECRPAVHRLRLPASP